MKTFGAIALAAFVAAVPAMAQGVRPSCAAVLESFTGLLERNDVQDVQSTLSPFQTSSGGCTARDLEIAMQGNLRIRIDKLAWSGAGFDRFVNEGVPPETLELEITAARVVPTIPDPVMQYILEEQSRLNPIDITLSSAWDATAHRLTLSALRATFRGDNEIFHSAVIESVDLSSQSALQMSAGSFSIVESTMEITSNGLFESYVLPALAAGLLSPDDDPKEQVDALKEKALEEIALFPDAIVPPASRAALRALVSDMPRPSGTLRVHMTASPGLGPARFLRLAQRSGMTDLKAIWPLLNGVELKIVYDP